MKYKHQTIIEPIYDGYKTAVTQYKVVAQDSSFPYALFYGTYEECIRWGEDNCEQYENNKQ